MKPDFGAAADDYARYRAGFPDSLFDRLRAFGIGVAGQTVVDLGTGTGTLARGFACRRCTVFGIDPAASMLDAARELDAEARVSVEYRMARAEETGLPDACADVVSAGQCWHWFERARAACEVARLLRPAGRLVVAHFDWIPLEGNVVEATEELIQAHNPEWRFGGGHGVHPEWLRELGEAGFRDLETFSYDVDVPYAPDAWRGRVRASAGVRGSMALDEVEAFDAALRRLLQERFPDQVLQVPHRVFAVVARPPGRASGGSGRLAASGCGRAQPSVSMKACTRVRSCPMPLPGR